jgi:hypothetical protein
MGLCLPGCSRFTASGRMDRAYYKQLNQVKKEKEKRRKEQMKRQRAETIPPKNSTPPPLQQPTYQTMPDGQ